MSEYSIQKYSHPFNGKNHKDFNFILSIKQIYFYEAIFLVKINYTIFKFNKSASYQQSFRHFKLFI